MTDSKKGYVLVDDAAMEVDYDERDRVSHRRRVKKGEIINLTDEQAERLLRSGSVREQDADVDDDEDATGDSTPGDGLLPVTDRTGGGGDAEQRGNTAVDYTAMEYGDLQRLAKDKTGSGAGSKQDLVDRLQAHDAEHADDEDDDA